MWLGINWSTAIFKWNFMNFATWMSCASLCCSGDDDIFPGSPAGKIKVKIVKGGGNFFLLFIVAYGSNLKVQYFPELSLGFMWSFSVCFLRCMADLRMVHCFSWCSLIAGWLVQGFHFGSEEDWIMNLKSIYSVDQGWFDLNQID